jgi:glycosyltransferase involved in cell wall biosynthesis
MRVLFDYQAFNQRVGGVSRYYIELIKNFSDHVDVLLPSLLSDNIYLNEIGVSNYSFFPTINSTLKSNIYKSINILSSIYSIKQTEYDLFHPTFLNPYFIKRTKKPIVVTIHDLNHDKFPNMLPKSHLVIEKERKIIQSADSIIAISEETKNDLIRFHNVSEDKINVVYHGVSQSPIVCDELPVFDKPYLLYVGGRNSYKNFQTLLHAFSLIDSNIHLVCTGNPFTPNELICINNYKLQRRIHHMFVSNKELNNLFYYAISFIYPSIGEGFGLPILESFRCSCPCIISDLRCFHEVAGDAAVYFNPNIVESMFSAINETIYDPMKMDQMRTLGFERLKLFTWEKTARETEQVYKNICF